MQALHDGSGIDEVPATKGTHEVRIQLRDFDPCGPMHDAGEGIGKGGAGERHPGKWKWNQKPRYPTSLPEPKAFNLASKDRLGTRMGLFFLAPVSVHWMPGTLEIHATLNNKAHLRSSREG